jgi:hypothetical protein
MTGPRTMTNILFVETLEGRESLPWFCEVPFPRSGDQIELPNGSEVRVSFVSWEPHNQGYRCVLHTTPG